MATFTEYIKKCANSGCGIEVRTTTWSCGCVGKSVNYPLNSENTCFRIDRWRMDCISKDSKNVAKCGQEGHARNHENKAT